MDETLFVDVRNPEPSTEQPDDPDRQQERQSDGPTRLVWLSIVTHLLLALGLTVHALLIHGVI